MFLRIQRGLLNGRLPPEALNLEPECQHLGCLSIVGECDLPAHLTTLWRFGSNTVRWAPNEGDLSPGRIRSMDEMTAVLDWKSALTAVWVSGIGCLIFVQNWQLVSSAHISGDAQFLSTQLFQSPLASTDYLPALRAARSLSNETVGPARSVFWCYFVKR